RAHHRVSGLHRAAGPHELVTDVAYGADQLLVLGAELGPQAPDVYVDGPRAAEEVVAPDLLQQLRPGEHPARVLRKVLEQLELLVGEVERAAAQAGRVGRLVDDELTELQRTVAAAGRVGTAALDQAQPRVHLGGPRGRQQDLVHTPFGVDG